MYLPYVKKLICAQSVIYSMKYEYAIKAVKWLELWDFLSTYTYEKKLFSEYFFQLF